MLNRIVKQTTMLFRLQIIHTESMVLIITCVQVNNCSDPELAFGKSIKNRYIFGWLKAVCRDLPDERHLE